MIINYSLLGINPFFTAYIQSDLIGKLIFLSLIGLSIGCWTVLIYKILVTRKARKLSNEFRDLFERHHGNPLSLVPKSLVVNPYLSIYSALKKHTLDILNKNQHFGDSSASSAYLSPTDIDFVDSHAITAISDQTKKLEKNLYILSTIVTLAPFLGLLGTVWGILNSFTELQVHPGGNMNQVVLGGLSLALTTTVLGLIDAIPALIGYNYLKHLVRDFQIDMESFSNNILASVELQYRQVDIYPNPDFSQNLR